MELVQQVSRGLEGTGIPVVDVGAAVIRDSLPGQLAAHPTDHHPNEVAHGRAAEELLRFLRRERLLVPR
jgi:hypothetical protein